MQICSALVEFIFLDGNNGDESLSQKKVLKPTQRYSLVIVSVYKYQNRQVLLYGKNPARFMDPVNV